MRFKVGDLVFAMDDILRYSPARRQWVLLSRDMPRPRLRIVVKVVHELEGCVCATVEGGLPFFFFTNIDLRPATKSEVESYKPVNWKLGSEYERQARGRRSDSEAGNDE